MRYAPDKHHRRSIRLKGYDYSAFGAYFVTICAYQRECLFGEVVSGEMRLNQLGQLVWSHWQNLPHHHGRLQLDAFIVMPNHIHGILILRDDQPIRNGLVGAGLADPASTPTNAPPPKPALLPEDASIINPPPHHTFPPKPATLNQRHSIAEIIRGFKTFSARRINQLRQSPGVPVWQRNYHEHIIRDEIALNNIRQYVTNNPKTWGADSLRLGVPAK